ncbi:Imm7 family immunity protein [Kribbella sp. VKM Ac-2568]|uniref:Imm7 family immunity protein n=1 Tax=Kribbella sp. VKM Ac-2568 TaxID=2512219 RepID=UPI00104BDF96|nr:Imm7 family immunity protein [Kribbella sp. VKM Ac-2568]TCM47898.1 immunity protein 7 of polymorphic toxin system [Kribbella sp. VKM Ac-2568]
MFEWHGWATIVASSEAEEDAEADGRQRGVEARVAQAVASAKGRGVVNETADLRHANGSLHLWLAGSHNHRAEAVIDLFRSVARIAPGSYGVMYVFDDDLTDTWERWVMRRGSVNSEVDASLSPHVGMVEDPYNR